MTYDPVNNIADTTTEIVSALHAVLKMRGGLDAAWYDGKRLTFSVSQDDFTQVFLSTLKTLEVPINFINPNQLGFDPIAKETNK